MRRVRTTCPYCGVGCGLIAEVADGGGVAITGDPDHPANFGRVCTKGATLAETLDGPRLTRPLYRGEPIGWSEALDLAAEELCRTLRAHGPEAVGFYLSGQMLIEDYYVFNKLAKGFIGTANIDTNSRLCMASAVVAHRRAFGEDLVPVAYEDLEEADLVVLWGSNLAICHPVLFQRLQAARERDPSKTLVVIDPRRSESAAAADLHLPIAPGTDGFLANGLLAFLQKEDRVDWEFVAARTEGFPEALAAARRTAGSIPEVARHCGLPEAAIARFFRLFATTERTVSVFSQGINQSATGSDKANAIINLHLATGRIGRPGRGPFSITGQPNAMGGREVGGLATALASHLEFSEVDRRALARFWGSERLVERPGLKAVELFEAVRAGRIRWLWIVATNPLVSLPDRSRVEEALARCPFVIVSEMSPESDTARFADLLLPAAAWGEKDGTVTNSERRLSRQRPFRSPPGEARADWWMAVELARRLGFGDAFRYDRPAAIFREYAASTRLALRSGRLLDLTPLAALGDAEYDALQPVQWPLEPDRGSVRLFADERFAHADGRARFIAVTPHPPRLALEPRRPLRLLTGRVRDQWHTMTRTGLVPRLAATDPEPFLAIHPDDAALLQLEAGAIAEIESDGGRMLARVRTDESLRVGTLFAPMHWSQRFAREAAVNALVPAIVDPLSGEPEFKAAAVRVRPFRARWYAFWLGVEPAALGGEYEVRLRIAGGWRVEAAGSEPPAAGWRELFSELAAGEGERLELADSGSGVFRAALLRDGRIRALLFVSPHHRLPPREWLVARFAEERLDPEARRDLLLGFSRRGAPGERVVCLCANVTERRLLEAIAAGARTPAALARSTGAARACGSCRAELERLLATAAAAE